MTAEEKKPYYRLQSAEEVKNIIQYACVSIDEEKRQVWFEVDRPMEPSEDLYVSNKLVEIQDPREGLGLANRGVCWSVLYALMPMPGVEASAVVPTNFNSSCRYNKVCQWTRLQDWEVFPSIVRRRAAEPRELRAGNVGVCLSVCRYDP